MPGSAAAQRGDLPLLLEPGLVVRCLARVGFAFVLYLGAHELWVSLDLRARYAELLLAVALPIVRLSSHFPLDRFRPALSIINLDFPLVFAACLWAVSPRLWNPRGALRLGLVALVVLACGVATVGLQLDLSTAQQMQRDHGILVRLPWEYWTIGAVKYLLQGLGLQLQPFLIAYWFVLRPEVTRPKADAHRPRALRLRPGRLALACVVGAACLAAVGMLSWRATRAADPRHQAAHVVIGDLLAAEGDTSGGRVEYERALAENPSTPDARVALSRLEGLARKRR